MDERVRREIEAIGSDNSSGATALLRRGLEVLQRLAGSGPEALRAAAVDLWRAQPSMAGFRTAGAIVLSAPDPGVAIERFARRVDRAPAAIARHASILLSARRNTGPLRLVTCSRSHCVEEALVAVAPAGDVIVACAEGRPALEGRRLAEALAARGLRVELFSDAAVGVALARAEAFLVGADALTDGAFINKVGTGALASLAGSHGVPSYVLAGTEKIVPRAVFSSMPCRKGPAEEIWSDPPSGVVVLNPYFEEVRLATISAFITDSGLLGPDEVGEASLWPPSFIEYSALI